MSNLEDTYHLGVKALIRNSDGKILLLKVNTAKLKNTRKAYWDIPGGRVERGSTVEETLKREIEEEIGIKENSNVQPLSMVLSNIRIPIEPVDVGLILAIYTCEIGPESQLQISAEHTEFGWFNLDNAAELLQVKYPPSFTDQLQKLA